MADEPVIPVAPAAAAPAPSAPAVEVTAPAPVAAVAEVPAAPAAAEPIAAPVVEAPKVDAPAAVEPPPSVLSEAKPKAPEPAKVAEAPKAEVKEGEKPAEEAKATDAPLPLPKYGALKLPEGVKLEDAKVAAFDEMLGKFQNATKADQPAMEAFRQELTDFYVKQQTEIAQRQQALQSETWNRVREVWKDKFRKDPEIGGNRHDTTVQQCGAMLERYANVVGADRAAELRVAFRLTGMGDHPEMIRFVNWASQFTTERSRPVAATVPTSPSRPQTRGARRYAGSAPSNGAA